MINTLYCRDRGYSWPKAGTSSFIIKPRTFFTVDFGIHGRYRKFGTEVEGWASSHPARGVASVYTKHGRRKLQIQRSPGWS